MIGELQIRVHTYSLVDIGDNWNSPDAFSSYWRFYINNTDGAELILPTGRYPLPKNRIHLIPAWLHFGLSNHRTIKHFYFHFDLMGLTTKIHKKVFNRPFTLNQSADFDATTRSVLDLKNDVQKLCRVKTLIYQSLTELLCELPPEQMVKVSQSLLAQSRFASTLQYIEHHLSTPLTNDRLAAVSHMSESHFASCFKKHLGQPPAQYVLHRRIAWSAQQLLFTRDPIEKIAEQAGFANRFHFTRQFTRYMGSPPAAYRKTTPV